MHGEQANLVLMFSQLYSLYAQISSNSLGAESALVQWSLGKHTLSLPSNA